MDERDFQRMKMARQAIKDQDFPKAQRLLIGINDDRARDWLKKVNARIETEKPEPKGIPIKWAIIAVVVLLIGLIVAWGAGELQKDQVEIHATAEYNVNLTEASIRFYVMCVVSTGRSETECDEIAEVLEELYSDDLVRCNQLSEQDDNLFAQCMERALD